MSRTTEKVTIHTKKFYRVVLEGFDPAFDTVESFAVKLSMRTRVSLPRARQLIRGLPRIVKSNLSSAQANRLKGVLEEIGGKARIETHLVTPGENNDIASDLRSGGDCTDQTIVCPSCGWEEKAGAAFCSICLRKFRTSGSRSTTLAERLPEANPLKAGDEPAFDRFEAIKAFAKKNRLAILVGIIALLLVFIVSK